MASSGLSINFKFNKLLGLFYILFCEADKSVTFICSKVSYRKYRNATKTVTWFMYGKNSSYSFVDIYNRL